MLRPDRLTDALTKGRNPHGVQAELFASILALLFSKPQRSFDVE
jgi:hypothetical protein